MYAVIKYFNYRKDVSVEILQIHHKRSRALTSMDSYAEKHFGKGAKLVDDIQDEWVYMKDLIDLRTIETGYDRWVFAVIELPEIEGN